MFLSISIAKLATLVAVGAALAEAAPTPGLSKPLSPTPFVINLSGSVPRMLDLINNTVLPDQPEYLGVGSSAGIDLDVLKQLRQEWVTNFDWQAEEAALNR